MNLSEMLSSMKKKLPEGGAASLNKIGSFVAGAKPIIKTVQSAAVEELGNIKQASFTAPSVSLSITMEDMSTALEYLSDISGAENFTDAIEVAWFNIGTKDKTSVGLLSMLTTIYRCSLDGGVTPQINVEELYKESRERVMSQNVLRPGPGLAPGAKNY